MAKNLITRVDEEALAQGSFNEVVEMLVKRVNDLERRLSAITSADDFPRCNPSATTSPTVNDDITQGYTPFSFWLDTSTSRIYFCLSNTAGAADWDRFSTVP